MTTTTTSLRRRLYVDALNYAGYFFPISKSWCMKKAFHRVKSFVVAAKNSGWQISVFIDNTAVSEEAQEKWKDRREADILNQRKNMPQGCSQLLGDMFRKCGVKVYYSDEADNDDTLAYFAYHNSADILSNDKDFGDIMRRMRRIQNDDDLNFIVSFGLLIATSD